jgi:TM2 domain-containing membrane protein YozV
MKRNLFLLSLIVVIVFSACSKQPYYFSGSTVAYNKKQDAEKATLTAQEEKVITAESIPSKEATNSTDATVTASTIVTPTTIIPKLNKVKTPGSVTTEQLLTKKDLKKAIKEVKKEAAKKDKQDGSSSGKSQLVALLLAAFIGVLGIHRFYLGYTTIGVLQILTLGGCGIWSLIDFIRILTGDLKPANGDYSEKL